MRGVSAFIIVLVLQGFLFFLTGGYVEALELTKEAPSQGAFRPHSISEETYDDVEYPGRKE